MAHQTQWVWALCKSMPAARAAFGKHVERHGGRDNWWQALSGLDLATGTLWFAPRPKSPGPAAKKILQELRRTGQFQGAATEASLEEGELSYSFLPNGDGAVGSAEHQALDWIGEHLGHEAHRAEVQATRTTPDAWLREAWKSAFVHLDLGGPFTFLDDEPPREMKNHLRAAEKAPLDQVAARFQSACLKAIRQGYRQATPGETSIHASLQREQRVMAYEDASRQMFKASFTPARLPFMWGRSPYEWIAHMVGNPKSEPGFLIEIDMHL